MQFQILECAIRKSKQHEGKESDEGEKRVLFQVGWSLLTTFFFNLPLLIVEFSGVKCTHIIVRPISRTLSSYKTETLHK